MSDGVFRRHRKSGDVFQAQVRVRPEGALRDGTEDIYESKMFKDYDEAVKWQKKRTAEIKGDLEAGRPSTTPKKERNIAFEKAALWALKKLTARTEHYKVTSEVIDGYTSNDKNLAAKLRWWLWLPLDLEVEKARRKAGIPEEADRKLRFPELAHTALSAVTQSELKKLSDAAVAKGDGSDQTQIHRVNAISWLFKTWREEHKIRVEDLPTPTDGARKVKPHGRDRRCRDERGSGAAEHDEEAALLYEARQSNSTWLSYAIIIAMDTAIRQEELVLLTWSQHVFLDVDKPHISLTKDIVKGSKGDAGGKPRTIALTTRAIQAFRDLKALNEEEVAAWNKAHPDKTPRKVSPKPIPVATTRGIAHAWSTMLDNARQRVVDERGITMEEGESTVFPNLHWHDLRHEGISRWFERTNENELKIKDMAGHGSLTTTSGYTHLRGQNFDVSGLENHKQPKPMAGNAVPDDPPGTVKLTRKGFVVMTMDGGYVPITEADEFEKSWAMSLIEKAAVDLGIGTLASAEK